MTIAIIADVLGEENNGTSITVKRLICNLKKRGHEVLVVSPDKSGEEGYYSVDKRDFKIFNDYFAKNGISLAKPNKEVLRTCIERSDMVHVLMPFSLGKAAVRLCSELQKPVTTAFHVQPENVTSHFGMLKSRKVNAYLYRYFWNGFYKYADYIHCPTEFIAAKLREHGYEQDLRVISNGVDPVFVPARSPKPAALEGKFCILTTGRLVKEKCQADLPCSSPAKARWKPRCAAGAQNSPTRPSSASTPKKSCTASSRTAIYMCILRMRRSNPSPASRPSPAGWCPSFQKAPCPPPNISPWIKKNASTRWAT